MPLASSRAVTSAALPAPNITVISTGLPPGNCWASALIDPTISTADPTISTAPAAAPIVSVMIRIRLLHHGSIEIDPHLIRESERVCSRCPHANLFRRPHRNLCPEHAPHPSSLNASARVYSPVRVSESWQPRGFLVQPASWPPSRR